MYDVCLKLQQKTQKYKADFILGKTYHTAFDCFFLKSSNRNNRYRLSINFKRAI